MRKLRKQINNKLNKNLDITSLSAYSIKSDMNLVSK